jgi:CBS domain-containing protein
MLTAVEIMTEQVVTIRSSATVAQAVELMKAQGISTLIVDRHHDRDAYGIVTKTDIVEKVAAYGKNPCKVRVYEIMTKPCIVVNPDLGVEYVARLFTNFGIRCAPVIKDELLGIISFTDILTKSDFVEKSQEAIFEEEIQRAIKNARAICADKGHSDRECKEAWDIVEELQAEAAHQQAKKIEKTALEEYLAEFPEAQEALIYKNWCSG